MVSRSAGAAARSLACPACTATARPRPRPSVTRESLVLNPPRLRPSAWSGGSPGGRFSPRARGGAVRPDDGRVHAEQLEVDRVVLRPQGALERAVNPVP